MRTKVQFISPLSDSHNIYYVRDGFGRVWHTVGKDKKDAANSIKCGEDVITFILYTPSKMGESPPYYDFKNLILDMMEQMELHDTYEYEIVIGWDNVKATRFMKMSTLLPCDLLIEINKYEG
ncbi:MAG: hypothetical protein ACQEXX_01970 [Bacillota bacterium]